MEILSLKNISKSFDKNEVLKDISISINEGEFVTFLGPSGCGKTTMLRIIAGLEKENSGKIFLNGEDITDKPPDMRDVNTVFQNYALFPHMTVEDNIGYGLKIKKTEKSEIKKRVREMIQLVKLEGYEKYKPSQLSGGQKQRVAVARAIINNPKILLLDEPLSALDLQMRKNMQKELKNLQKQTKITFIYITHDQEEAMYMSDRIVVMNNGVICQADTPKNIYDKPKTEFTAKFIGLSNIIKAQVENIYEDNISLRYENICVNTKSDIVCKKNDIVKLSVRSEDIKPDKSESGAFIVDDIEYLGETTHIIVKSNNTSLSASLSGSDNPFEIGDRVNISFSKAVILEEENV